MSRIWIFPFLLQALVMAVDEFYFHHRRGLPRWERIGHPLDTITLLACLGWALAVPLSSFSLTVYVSLAVFSVLFVTKDEAVHARYCRAGEHWLHSMLFTLHPVLLMVIGLSWVSGSLLPGGFWRIFLIAQFILMVLFLIYQVVYWNFLWKDRPIVPSTMPSMTP